jgi:ankyrin repeat protein
MNNSDHELVQQMTNLSVETPNNLFNLIKTEDINSLFMWCQSDSGQHHLGVGNDTHLGVGNDTHQAQAVDHLGRTPLMLACLSDTICSEQNIINYLLRISTINHTDHKGENVLFYLAKRSNVYFTTELIHRVIFNVNIFHVNNLQQSALEIACVNHNENVVKAMLPYFGSARDSELLQRALVAVFFHFYRDDNDRNKVINLASMLIRSGARVSYDEPSLNSDDYLIILQVTTELLDEII